MLVDTYLKIKSITPSDSEDIDMYVRGLYVGVGGLVKVTDYYGTICTFMNVASGSTIPVMVKRVHATGTTATNIIALQ